MRKDSGRFATRTDGDDLVLLDLLVKNRDQLEEKLAELKVRYHQAEPDSVEEIELKNECRACRRLLRTTNGEIRNEQQRTGWKPRERSVTPKMLHAERGSLLGVELEAPGISFWNH